MYNFEYVSKKNAAKVKIELKEIIHKVKDCVSDDFTFRYDFVGSSSRNMITHDPKSNIGFDFDVNLEVNDDKQEYSPGEIKNILINAFNKVIRSHGYDKCENSTRVITIKKIDRRNSRIIHSCDFAIIHNYTDDSGKKRQQYIRFNKNNNNYTWEMQTSEYDTKKKSDWLKRNDHWSEVRDRYIEKKNCNKIVSKKSRSLYAETINEIYMKYFNYNEKSKSDLFKKTTVNIRLK